MCWSSIVAKDFAWPIRNDATLKKIAAVKVTVNKGSKVSHFVYRIDI